MKTLIKRAAISLVIALLLTLSTLLIPTGISSPSDMENISFGLPFPFLTEKSQAIVNASFFPFYVFSWTSGMEFCEFGILNFFLDFLIIFIVVFSISFTVKRRK